jgi:hypothetical protein
LPDLQIARRIVGIWFAVDPSLPIEGQGRNMGLRPSRSLYQLD